jgi:transcriptional regulator GlxA family with amidase domain
MRTDILAVAAGAAAALFVIAQPTGPLAQIARVATVSSTLAADRLIVPSPKAGRQRPLVVVVGENAGAETTDFIIPFGMLRSSGVADVRSLSTAPGPIRLRMSLKILADQTLEQFDAAEPKGADIVIVPAQAAPGDAGLTAWVKRQAAKGATIVSVCEGARVLANAGLLNGRRATTHWMAITGLEKRYRDTIWVRDRRYVQDGPVITTAGVTAAIPMSLALVEAIGGRAAAEQTARRFGVTEWSAAHRSADFQLRNTDVSAALWAMTAFWAHETVEVPIVDGVDEVALALRADAWSRTFRTRVVTTHAGRAAVRSRDGLTILPDTEARPDGYVMPAAVGSAVQQLDASIAALGKRYGPQAARLAVLGLEYDPPGLFERRALHRTPESAVARRGGGGLTEAN